ncbi:MAG: hypothetical protein WC553_02180 [Patescibacteria group bacterium]|jgi:hypothetical protein
MVPSWDLVLLVFGGASVVYSLMLREKVVVTLLAAYAGMIVADRWGEALYQVLTKQGGSVLNEQFVSGNVSVLTVQIALFAAVMLIIALRGGVLIHPDSVGIGFMSYLVLIAYGLLTAAVIASALLGFVPQDQLDQIYASSKLAKQLVDYQAWLLVLPLILMMISGWGQKD